MNTHTTALFAVGGTSAIAGIAIFALPQTFYDLVPGLDAMSPFSVHFIRDVGLAYFASGTLLVAAGWLEDRRLAIAGCLWFVLHALFHVHIWAQRGFPFDSVFCFDFLAVIGPSLIALWASVSLERKARS